MLSTPFTFWQADLRQQACRAVVPCDAHVVLFPISLESRCGGIRFTSFVMCWPKYSTFLAVITVEQGSLWWWKVSAEPFLLRANSANTLHGALCLPAAPAAIATLIDDDRTEMIRAIDSSQRRSRLLLDERRHLRLVTSFACCSVRAQGTLDMEHSLVSRFHGPRHLLRLRTIATEKRAARSLASLSESLFYARRRLPSKIARPFGAARHTVQRPVCSRQNPAFLLLTVSASKYCNVINASLRISTESRPTGPHKI